MKNSTPYGHCWGGGVHTLSKSIPAIILLSQGLFAIFAAILHAIFLMDVYNWMSYECSDED
jgi:hypothetical protein